MADSQPLSEPTEYPLIMQAPIVPEVVFAPLELPALPDVDSSSFLIGAEVEEAAGFATIAAAPRSETPHEKIAEPATPSLPAVDLSSRQMMDVLGALAGEGIVASFDVLSARLNADRASVERTVERLHKEGLARTGNYSCWVELTTRGRMALQGQGEDRPRATEVDAGSHPPATKSVKAGWFGRMLGRG